MNYTDNGYLKVTTKTDAKGQLVMYTYDNMARVTKVQRYPMGRSGSEDICQQENYTYDQAPPSNYPQNYYGRRTSVQYFAPAPGLAGTGCGSTIVEQYGYNPGRLKNQQGIVDHTYASMAAYRL